LFTFERHFVLEIEFYLGVAIFGQKPINPVVAELALLGMSSKLDHYKLYYIGVMTNNSHTHFISYGSNLLNIGYEMGKNNLFRQSPAVCATEAHQVRMI